MAKPTPQTTPRLADEIRGGTRDLAATGGVALLVSLIGFVLAIWYIEPPPPSELKIATGPADGEYTALGERLADFFSKRGVTLTVVRTAGTVENYRLLLEDPSVRLAIVQGGAAPAGRPETQRLESLATLFPEPLWVFYRRELTVERLTDLEGLRVAIGKPGSGCRLLATELLAANGVDTETGGTLVELAPAEAATQLEQGDIDAAFFVVSPNAPLIGALLGQEGLALLSIDRAVAYDRRYPALHEFVLPRGLIDLRRDLPPRDVTLVAPSANLVATPELHDAFIPLLLEAADAGLEPGSGFVGYGEGASLEGAEFPVNAVARHYFKSGPPFLQRYLGFWLASLVDRAKIMIVPLVVLCIPAIKMWPPVYRWRIRSRIYRWYGLLREIDQQTRDSSAAEADALRTRLKAIEFELEQVSVPLSYMEEFYNLRLHIDLVLRRLEEGPGPTRGASE